MLDLLKPLGPFTQRIPGGQPGPEGQKHNILGSKTETFAQHFRSNLSLKTYWDTPPLPPNLISKKETFRSKLSLNTFWDPNPIQFRQTLNPKPETLNPNSTP